MATITNQYYAALFGEQGGPFSGEELTAMVEKGRLTGDTLVWRDGMAEWVEAASVAELGALIDEAAARRKEEEAAEAEAQQKAEDGKARKKAEAAQKKAEDAQQRAEAAQKKAAVDAVKKKRLSFRLLIVGIVLLVLTLFLEFEDLPLIGFFGLDNEWVAMIAWICVAIGGFMTVTRWLQRRRGK
jgi:cation transport ATPase